MSRVLWAAGAVLLAAAMANGDDPKWRATGRHVMVIYQADGGDRDRSGKGDSREVAEYYAARRNVPPENLLGLKLTRIKPSRGWKYSEFYSLILKPIAAALAAKGPDGRGLSERISYLLLCPGVPHRMDSGHRGEKGEKDWFKKTSRRSVDQFLISLEANLAAGLDAESGAVGAGRAGPLGASRAELVLPIFAHYARPKQAKHFRRLRQEYPKQINFRLVSRLGLDQATARDMLDGALYAERYLRLPAAAATRPAAETRPAAATRPAPTTRPAAPPPAPFSPERWLDYKRKFAGDHVLAQRRMVLLVRGLGNSPFTAGKGLLRTWPLVIDAAEAEIGAGKDSAHVPTVAAAIATDGVKPGSLALKPPAGGRQRDISPTLFFPPGCEITNGTARARVLAADPQQHRLTVSSSEGFKGGQTVRWVWPGLYPADDCFFFYGFYGLGKYEDVFRFPPGSMGIHVDSACMVWARNAIGRGIAATFGVTTEPLSAGIPYGDLVLRALAGGYDWAEANHAAVMLGQRWAGVLFGDPLYAPFRSRRLADRTPPVIGAVQAKSAGGAVTITASLAGKTDDELADVALFRLDYGPTKACGQAVDFCDWPEPDKARGVKGRRFGFSRHFRATLKGLTKGKTYHYRLTARDPAGLETRTPDATFTP